MLQTETNNEFTSLIKLWTLEKVDNAFNENISWL